MEWRNLTPFKTKPLEGIVYSNPTKEDIDLVFSDISKDEILFFDYEANGTDWLAEGFYSVGVAFSCLSIPAGVYFNTQTDEIKAHVLKHMRDYQLSCFNLTYDAGVREIETRRISGKSTLKRKDFNYHSDVLGIIKHLDQKTGFGFSLKEMMKTLLLWEKTNEEGVDNWLIEHGYTKGTKAEPKPDKSYMYLVPPEILGKYACLDTQATMEIYYKVIVPALKEWPDVLPFHQTASLTLYKLIIEAKIEGITVDLPKLEKWREYLIRKRDHYAELFTYSSEATPYLEEVLKERIDKAFYKEHPGKEYSKKRENKDGSMNHNYRNWLDKEAALYDNLWDELNLNSRDQVRIALYDKWLGKENWSVEPLIGYGGKQRTQFKNKKLEFGWELHVGDEVIDFWSSAESSKGKIANPPTNKHTVHLFGDAGKYYLEYTRAVKELGYVTAMLGSSPNGIHPTQLRPHGTLSNRCSGSSSHYVNGEEFKVNIQQVPKSAGYLRCLGAPEGREIIQADFTALEPMVTAEVSKCPSYKALYGDPDKPNDVYLFVMAGIDKFKDEICSLGYDPFNPTKEAISKTKKAFKNLRGVGKVVHLAASYGAGVSTIHKNILKSGVDMSSSQAREVYDGYWDTFKRIKDFEKTLHEEVRVSEGILVNGLGHPYTIKPKHKDILNRFIQSTGVGILDKHLFHIDILREERGVDLKAMIPSFHDETLFTVPKEQSKEAEKLFYDAVDMTNEWLGGELALRCDPEIVNNIAEVKVEHGGGMYSEELHGEEFDLMAEEGYNNKGPQGG